MKKLAYMGIGALFMLVLSFAWLTFADQTTTSAPPAAEPAAATGTVLKKVEGKITSLDPQTHTVGVFDAKANARWELVLAPDTTVYRNGQITDFSALRVGDSISAFVNTEQGKWRVRYVIAKGSEALAAEPSATETAATSDQSAAPPVSASPHTPGAATGSTTLTSHTPLAAPAVPAGTSTGGTGKPLAVKELALEVKLANGEEYELKFKQNGWERAYLRTFVERLGLSPNMDNDEIAARVLQALGITGSDFEKIEVAITFVNEKKVELKLESGHGKGKGKGKGHKKGKHGDDDDEEDD